MPVPTVQLTGSAIHGVQSHLLGDRLVEQLPVTVKLGRIRPKAVINTDRYRIRVADDGTHRATPLLRAHFHPDREGVTVPPNTNYRAKAAPSIARMYLNNQYGDCVIAGKYHAVGIWTANDSPNVVVGTDEEVLQAYHTICGPGDNGCQITAVLDYWKKNGLPFGGTKHYIDGYVSADWTNKLETQVVQYLFGATSIGINLPQAWTSNAVWDVTDTPIVGGHDVTPIDCTEQGVIISSWGRLYTITWDAWQSRKWIEEYDVPLSPDWYGSDRLSPAGVSADTLLADLKLVHQGIIPDVGPTPVPPGPGPVPVPPVPPSPAKAFSLHFPRDVGPGDIRLHLSMRIQAADYDCYRRSVGDPSNELLWDCEAMS